MFNFFKKLLPNFEKRKLLNQCDILRVHVSEILLPYITELTTFIHTSGLRETSSKTGLKLQKALKSKLDRVLLPADKVNYATLLKAVLTQLDTKVALLHRFVDANFNREVSTSGINFKQLHIMRLIDLGHFFVNYSFKILDQISFEEANNAAIRTENPLTPAEVKWLNDNFDNYLTLAAIFTEKETDFARMIEQTTQVIVAESEDNAQVTGLNTDPHKLGVMPVIGDMVLFLGEQIVLYQHNQYESYKARLKIMQLRLLAAQQKLQEGDGTMTDAERAAIIKSINYWTDKIKALEYKIKKYEEKAGINNG